MNLCSSLAPSLKKKLIQMNKSIHVFQKYWVTVSLNSLILCPTCQSIDKYVDPKYITIPGTTIIHF